MKNMFIEDIWKLAPERNEVYGFAEAIRRKEDAGTARPRSILKRKMVFVEREIIPEPIPPKRPSRAGLPKVVSSVKKSKKSGECLVCENLYEKGKGTLFCTKACGLAYNASLVFPDGYDNAVRLRYVEMHLDSLRRKKGWSFSPESFRSYWGLPCHYCGESMHGKLGLDRVDSSGPYSPDNVVSCCGECNMMKRTMGYDKFINRCGLIYARHGGRKSAKKPAPLEQISLF